MVSLAASDERKTASEVKVEEMEDSSAEEGTSRESDHELEAKGIYWPIENYSLAPCIPASLNFDSS